jgi:hypothetical protein
LTVKLKLPYEAAGYRVLAFEQARANLIRAYEEGRIRAEELPPGVLKTGLPAKPRPAFVST